MMPTYRLPQAFGRMSVLDEYGLCEQTSDARELGCADAPWIEEENGKIPGFRLPDGREASADDLERDAQVWAQEFARDARSCMIQNHEHSCADTCVKYACKNSQGDEYEKPQHKASSWNVSPCRFQFFVILVFLVLEGTKEVVRRVLRRGKALVSKAYIALTNDRNEYGSFIPHRQRHLRSSTSDVHQVIFRCNGDVQFKNRTIPADVFSESSGASERTASDSSGAGSSLVCVRTAG